MDMTNAIKGGYSAEKTKVHLNSLGKKIGDNLDMEEIEKVFLLTVEDFRKDDISLDELSGICNYLWSMAIEKSMANQQLSSFADLLLRGAEISYYIRKADNEEAASIAMKSLGDILRYQKQN